MASTPDQDWSAAGTAWSLRLFGELRLLSPGGKGVNLPGRRERAVLAYLALVPDCRENRRKLVEILWGDRAVNSTLDNLRTCLWSLRKAVGEEGHSLVLSDRDWIRLEPSRLAVDYWLFRRLLDSGSVEDLERAAEMGSGQLLEGFDLDSEEFSDWLRNERTRCADTVMDALSRLLDTYERMAAPESMLSTSQRMLRLDPFSEVALRGMMKAYAASGRRNMALQAFRSFAENLEKELGVTPEAETRDAYARLRAGVSGGCEGSDEVPASEEAPLPPAPTSEPIRVAGAAPPAPSPRPEPSVLPAEAVLTPVPAARGSRRASFLACFRVPIWAFFGAASIALAVLVFIGVIFWRVPALAPAYFSGWISGIKEQVEGAPPAIAVLPFRGYGTENVDNFADAISDGVANTLSLVSEMLVISRSSVQRYKGSSLPAPEIARELGVRYLLEGNVARFGDTVTVRVGLIDVAQGERTMSIGTLEKKVADFYTLQGEITINIVTALRVRLTEGVKEQINQEHGTKNFRAWLLASLAQKHLRELTPKDNITARRHYEEAVAVDPGYAGAWTGLAWTYLMEARFVRPAERPRLIENAARIGNKSLALDNRRGATFALLGSIALFSGKHDIAKEVGERSVELEYNDPDSLVLYALTLTYTGEPRKAINLIRRAIQLRPYPPRWYIWLLARAHRLAGQPSEAIALLTPATSLADRSVAPLVELAAAYSEMGAMIQGHTVADEIRRIDPDFSARDWIATPAYQDAKDTRRDLKALAKVGLRD